MKEGARISPQIEAVVGTVRIDYKDPITDKVVERIQSKNHVWEDTFTCSFWQSFLDYRFGGTNRMGQLFLTDSDAPVTDAIPYQQGNIIGWGVQGQGAWGIRQGSWSTSNSILGQSRMNGNGILYRHAYDFTIDQVPDTIGSVSFTPQYRPSAPLLNASPGVATTPFAFRPLRERRLRTWSGGGTGAQNSVMKDNMRYWIVQGSNANNAVVTVHRMNMLTGDSVQIPVTGFTSQAPAGVQNRSIGVSADSTRMYIMTTSEVAAVNRVWEFSDDTFDDSALLAVHVRPEFRQQPWYNVFVENNGFFYSSGETGIRVYNVQKGTTGATGQFSTVDNVATCPYNQNLATSPSFLMVRNEVLYRFVTNPVDARAPFWDISNDTPVQIGTLGTIRTNSPTRQVINTCGIMTEPALGHRMALFGAHSDTGGALAGQNAMDFWTNQGLCCYALPDDAPVRPPQTGIMVSYQLEIMY